MSESGDYSPGVWAGHDFASARRTYDASAGRSYDVAVKLAKGFEPKIKVNIIKKEEEPETAVAAEPEKKAE